MEIMTAKVYGRAVMLRIILKAVYLNLTEPLGRLFGHLMLLILLLTVILFQQFGLEISIYMSVPEMEFTVHH